MKRTAVYPGSFDPITNGHADLVRRSRPVVKDDIVQLRRLARLLNQPENRIRLRRALAIVGRAVKGLDIAANAAKLHRSR